MQRVEASPSRLQGQREKNGKETEKKITFESKKDCFVSDEEKMRVIYFDLFCNPPHTPGEMFEDLFQ